MAFQQRDLASGFRPRCGRISSRDAVSTSCPAIREKATDETGRVWPSSSTSWRPGSASQMRAVLSDDPVTTRLPSGENLANETVRSPF